MHQYSNFSDYTWKAMLAEFIGTFTLVFVIGAAVTVGTSGVSNASIGSNAALTGSIAAALALVGLIYSWGWFSGAHLNPATSVAFWVAGRMSFWAMLAYMVVQLVAGIAAASLLAYIFAVNQSASVGTLTVHDSWKAVLVEAFLTFFLMITILFVTANPILAAVSGLAIGFMFGALMLSGFSLTGGSMNPARSLGPAIFTNNLGSVWVYFVGPLIGAIVAGLIYRLFKADFGCCAKKDECGENVKDACGNDILVCQRPCIDRCGNPVTDECGEVQYEEYEKRAIKLNHFQQTPLDLANQLASARGLSPIYIGRKLEKVLDAAAEKLEGVLCDEAPAATTEAPAHELKFLHTEFKGKAKLSMEHDEVVIPEAFSKKLATLAKPEASNISTFAPVVQNTGVKAMSPLSSFKTNSLTPAVLAN